MTTSPLHPSGDTAPEAPTPTVAELRAAVARVLPGVLADLQKLVRIPSVSAPAFDQANVEASAAAVADLLRAEGVSDVRVLRAGGGRPAVFGERRGPEGAPAVLLYAHHDVQPPGEETGWTTAPFEPVERDGRLYGRGAADDKAGVMAHIAALRAWRELGLDVPVTVRLFIEGEEEIGSPTLEALVQEQREALSADVIVLADSTNWAVGTPALTTTLRGLVDCVVEVRTLDHAVHSGMYGGAVPDALTALIRLLASLHDDAGNVAVQGLASRAAEDPGFDEEQLRRDAGVLEGVELIGEGSLAERLWTRPAVSVIGIDAPTVAASSNTLVPMARAKVSLRVPPGQDAEQARDALHAHLQSAAPWRAQVRVLPGEVGQPFAADAQGPAYDAARDAFAESWGTPPVDTGIGGSIPFVAAFAETFPNAAVLVTGVEDPDTRAHGLDESLHLGEFERVCLAEALLLRNLAARR
ncbi:MAG: dipeptidase [Actinomycetes bacterium]